jgi:DnaJ like chaperone protein
MLGGPLGGLLGAALGHSFDKGLKAIPDESVAWEPGDRERVQTAFFTATFSVMGHLAKADGRVSAHEIGLAEAVMAEMDLDPEMRQAAIGLFREGKISSFPFDEVLAQFRQECHGRRTLIRMFVEIQLQAAYADGRLDAAEDKLLRRVCERLGVSEFEFRQLRRMVEAERHFAGKHRRDESAGAVAKPTLADAYAILGVTPQASDAEIKKAYRRLLSQHHPDKLVSKGLPQEMMKMATQKTYEIKQSYERIKDARKL